VPYWERKFRQEAKERTVHFSTKIEGNKLNFEESKDIGQEKKIKTFRRRDIIEIINYREVIDFISNLRDQKVDKNLLFEIHKRVMKKLLPGEEIGKFRETEEGIVDSKKHELITEFIEPEFIEDSIEDLFNWLEKEGQKIHPVIRSGIISYELVHIHPFTDGNGRTARILATFSLYKDGYDIKRFFSLEEYYDQNLEEYYKAIESVEETDEDMTFWLEFFAKGLSIELSRIKNKILKLSRDFNMKKLVGQVALNSRQVKIIKFIQKNGSFRNQDYSDLLANVSDDTILRDLKDLIDKEILKKEGKTKSARYVIK